MRHTKTVSRLNRSIPASGIDGKQLRENQSTGRTRRNGSPKSASGGNGNGRPKPFRHNPNDMICASQKSAGHENKNLRLFKAGDPATSPAYWHPVRRKLRRSDRASPACISVRMAPGRPIPGPCRYTVPTSDSDRHVGKSGFPNVSLMDGTRSTERDDIELVI